DAAGAPGGAAGPARRPHLIRAVRPAFLPDGAGRPAGKPDGVRRPAGKPDVQPSGRLGEHGYEDSMNSPVPPRPLFTMGAVPGVGREITARAWPSLLPLCRPVVVGDPLWLRRALSLVGARAEVRVVSGPAGAEPAADRLPCVAASAQDLTE